MTAKTLIFIRPLRWAFAIVMLAAMSVSAFAEDAGSDGTLLIVTPLNGDPVPFSRDTLEALPQVSFTTSTPWTEGVSEYSGPTFADVLARSGIEEGLMRVEALNDYVIEMPVTDVDEAWPIVVTRMNGEPFSVADKGPLWLLYPFDDVPELLNEQRFLTSVWNLDRVAQIEVEAD